jgi:general secretion pathway protein A
VHVLRFNESEGSDPTDEIGTQTIYGSFFGLRERPFALTPNPRFLFLPTRQREALSSLRYGLSTPHGLTLLTGDAGCGKTTMLCAVLTELAESKTRCVLVNNPTLKREEFYEFLARAFGLSEQAAASKARFLEELQTFLESRFAEGHLTGLVIDEAQSLSYELLEEIRLLGNIETASTKLLNIVLSGQPELLERLQDPSLRQLKQRIGLRCELKTFDLSETAAYIAGRLRIAGGLPQDIFTQEAVMVISETTGGLPRTVNVLSENALISGFAEQVKPVPARIVRDVAREFEIRPARPEGTDDNAERQKGTESGAGRKNEEPDKPERALFGAVTRVKKRFSFFALLAAAALSVHPGPAHAQVAAPPAKPIATPNLEPTAPGRASEAALPTDYVIGPEDVLGVVFWRDADMTGDVTVRPDGMITLPLIGDLRAVGLKPESLRAAITDAAGKYLEDINVTVVIRQINSRKAFITGEVRNPNGYPLAGTRTVMQLIAIAGGLTEYADGKNITIMRTENGQTRTFKFNYKDVSKGKNIAQNIELAPGDTVVVP